MIFCLFLTAGHISHSTLVADQDFLTAKAKNVVYSSRNFLVRSKTICRNSNVFSSFLGRRGRGTDALKSLSLLSLSLLLSNCPQYGEPLDQPPEDPRGLSTLVDFFLV
jgi:hypothetical protein